MGEDAVIREDLVDGHGCSRTSGKHNNDNNCTTTPNNNNQLEEDGGKTRLRMTALSMATVALAPQASTKIMKTAQQPPTTTTI
jgi:hypothetical protein